MVRNALIPFPIRLVQGHFPPGAPLPLGAQDTPTKPCYDPSLTRIETWTTALPFWIQTRDTRAEGNAAPIDYEYRYKPGAAADYPTTWTRATTDLGFRYIFYWQMHVEIEGLSEETDYDVQLRATYTYGGS